MEREARAVAADPELLVRRDADNTVGVDVDGRPFCQQRAAGTNEDVRRRHVRHRAQVAVAVDKNGIVRHVLFHMQAAGESVDGRIRPGSILQVEVRGGVQHHAAVALAAVEQQPGGLALPAPAGSAA